jgi:hypothetical protein
MGQFSVENPGCPGQFSVEINSRQMLLGEVITIAQSIYNNQLITVWAESEPRPPAFLAFAEGGLRRVFCMACGRLNAQPR